MNSVRDKNEKKTSKINNNFHAGVESETFQLIL